MCFLIFCVGFVFAHSSLSADANFTVSGGGFSAPFFTFIDGDGQTPDFSTLPLYRGATYQFSDSGVSGSHPFMIGESYGDTSSSLVSGGQLNGSSGSITVTIPSDFNGSLYYFCTNHSNMIQEFTIATPNHVVDLNSTVNLEMIWVEPGTFTMGQSDIPDASPENNVTLTKGFYLGKYEVTQAQYEAVMSGNTETDSNGNVISATPSQFSGNPNRPVEKLSWEDIQVFLSRLNEQQAESLPVGWAYVLPTEAQWEYACRAGTTTAYSWGDTISASDANWNHGNDANQTENVGQYSANPWGFFDMHGNVYEWTADAWGAYPSGAQTDLFNAGTAGSSRVIRGGSWVNPGTYLPSAVRLYNAPSSRFSDFGFRVGFQQVPDKSPPAISAKDASFTGSTSATMNGDLLSYEGADPPSVSLYYGPTSLPLQNVELWLDADESTTVTHSSNAVSQWKDKSGKDNHTEQSAATSQPTLTASGLNGKPVIIFDGTSDHITSTDLNITQSYSMFLVAKTNNNASGRDYLFDGVGSTNSHRSLIALDNGGKIQMWAGSWANSNFNTPSGYFVLSAVFNTTSSSLSLNGTRANGLNVGSYNLTNGIRIGCNNVVSADYLDGAIAEFLILDETASLDTQNIVEGYLAHKWGLAGSLPSGHTYKSIASVATTSLGTKSAGTFTHNLTGLTAGQRYEFQFSASNAGGTTLSGVNSFVTLGLPQVLTPGATDVTKTSVTLNADLNSTGGVSYQSGAPFSGSTAPGMLMWMDGNDYNADGTADTTDANLANGTGWKDKSGNDRHATATGGDPRFMSNQLNGLGVIDFDGNDNVYVSNDAHSLAAHTDAFSAFLLVV